MIGMKQTKLTVPEARRVRGKSTPPLQQPGLIQVTVFQVTVFLGMGRVVLDWVGSRWVGSGFCGLDWVGVIALGCVFGLGVLGCIDFSGSRLTKDGYDWNQRNKDGRNVLNLVNQKGAAQSIRDKFKELQSRCFFDFHVPEGQTSGIAHHRSGGFSSARHAVATFVCSADLFFLCT
jgi:hypothetical protein